MGTQTDEVLLACRGVAVGHGGKALLPPIDLEVRRGEYWAIIGQNGAGKSTLLQTLLGLRAPVAGRIERAEKCRLAYLAQRQQFDDVHPLLAKDVVAMGLYRARSWLRPLGRSAVERIEQSLANVGALPLAARPFRQLSEGQKQRVLFARLAVSEPDLAVLDEPTSAMDPVAEREASELLKRLQQESGMALLVVSHDVRLVGEYANRALLLDRDGNQVVTGSPREVFRHDAFRHRYGQSLPPPPSLE